MRESIVKVEEMVKKLNNPLTTEEIQEMLDTTTKDEALLMLAVFLNCELYSSINGFYVEPKDGGVTPRKRQIKNAAYWYRRFVFLVILKNIPCQREEAEFYTTDLTNILKIKIPSFLRE